MGYEELLEKLNKNPREESLEAVRLIIRIADNIINDPSNIKIRTLKKSNPTISKKILQVNGGTMSLKLMGFQEVIRNFYLLINIFHSFLLCARFFMFLHWFSTSSPLCSNFKLMFC